MELHLETHISDYRVSFFDGNTVVIGKGHYTTSLIVTPELALRDWPPRCSSELTIDHFEIILALQPELILIGTGNALHFPDASTFKDVIRAGIGIEFMGSHAACRTYNVLASEGRHVAAGIIIDQLPRSS